MFRVYIEGKSPAELIKNTQAWLAMIDGGNETMAYAEGIGEGMNIKERSIKATLDAGKEYPFDVPSQSVPTFDPSSVGTQVPSAPVTDPSAGVDGRGIPWDGRIHSSSKEITKKGIWRTRRNVDEELVKKIESELASQPVRPNDAAGFLSSWSSPGNTVPPNVAVPVAPQPVVASPPTPNWGLPAAPVLAQPPVAFPPAAPPVQAAPAYDPIPIPQSTKPAHTLESFRQQYIPTIHGLVASGQISQEYLQRLIAHFGTKDIFDVNKNDLSASNLFETLVQAGMITKVG